MRHSIENWHVKITPHRDILEVRINLKKGGIDGQNIYPAVLQCEEGIVRMNATQQIRVFAERTASKETFCF